MPRQVVFDAMCMFTFDITVLVGVLSDSFCFLGPFSVYTIYVAGASGNIVKGINYLQIPVNEQLHSNDTQRS